MITMMIRTVPLLALKMMSTNNEKATRSVDASERPIGFEEGTRVNNRQTLKRRQNVTDELKEDVEVSWRSVSY